MVLQIWCVVLVFECQVSETVTSKDFVCKQLEKKTVRKNWLLLCLSEPFHSSGPKNKVEATSQHMR